MRVAIAGGLGFIPSRVARELDSRGHEVVLVDYASQSLHPLAQELLRKLELRHCDLTDADQTERVLADADAVFHAAALGTKTERDRPRETLHLNLLGSANTIEAARRGAARRYVLASSAVVYGEGGEMLREDAPAAESATIYAATKLAGEHLVSAYREQFGLSGMALRFMNVYGYQPPEWPVRDLTAKVLERIEAGLAPIVHGDGSSSFDLTHVDDIARAVVLALEHPDAAGAVNVGTGTGTSVRGVVELLLELTASELEPELHPEIDVPAKHYVADVSRARAVLGFEAEIDLASGLGMVIAEYRERVSLSEAA